LVALSIAPKITLPVIVSMPSIPPVLIIRRIGPERPSFPCPVSSTSSIIVPYRVTPDPLYPKSGLVVLISTGLFLFSKTISRRKS
jgi:hypothetical protein